MRGRLLVVSLLLSVATACAPRGGKPGSGQVMSFEEFKAIEAASVGAVEPTTAPSSEPGSTPVPDSNCTKTAKSALGGLNCQDLRQEFRYVVYVGKQIYCYWDQKQTETGIDYERLATELEAKITDQTTSSQYFTDVLQAWAASLHDGHVNVMAGDDLSSLEILHAEIRLRLLAPGTNHERVIVTASKNPRIPVGAQITRVNGATVDEAITAAEARQSGSTRRMRRAGAARKLLDAIGMERALEPLQIEFLLPALRAQGRLVASAQVPRVLDLNLPPRDAGAAGGGGEANTGENLVQAQLLPGQIGYLKIDGFMGTRLAEIFDLRMKQLKNAAALILDLRENGGGNQSGNRILRWLSKEKFVRYSASTRRSDFLLPNRPDLFKLGPDPADNRFWAWEPQEIEPTKEDEGTFAGKPVVALTSPSCFSACDTFASALQTNGLAVIVGEGTGGGTGSPEVFELPVSGLRFRYSVARGQNAKGAPLEGVGTLPDVTAEYAESDLGKDPISDSQTAKAIEVVLARLGGNPVPPPPPPVVPAPVVSETNRNGNHSATTDELLQLELESQFRE
jgi:hypothetical protein